MFAERCFFFFKGKVHPVDMAMSVDDYDAVYNNVMRTLAAPGATESAYISCQDGGMHSVCCCTVRHSCMLLKDKALLWL